MYDLIAHSALLECGHCVDYVRIDKYLLIGLFATDSVWVGARLG